MRPKQGLELCQKPYQAQRERTKATFYSRTEEWVLPAASTKEAEERGRFRSEYAYGQQARPSLCWVGDHEDIEESDDVDGRPTARWQTREEATGICQRIGLFVTVMFFSWRNSRKFFLSGSSARIMGVTHYWNTHGPYSLLLRSLLLGSDLSAATHVFSQVAPILFPHPPLHPVFFLLEASE